MEVSVMGMNLSCMQVAVLMLVTSGNLIDQIINQAVLRHAVLIAGVVSVTQMLNGCRTVGDFIFAYDHRKRRATGIGTLHL